MANLSYATSINSATSGAVGWFNFGAGFSITPGQTIKGLTGTFLDGSTVTFDLTSQPVLNGGEKFVSTTAPTWPFAAFGQTGYQSVTGQVCLYSVSKPGSLTTELTFSNITVLDPLGNPIPTYHVVLADTESTGGDSSAGDAEFIEFVTNSTPWALWQNLPPVPPPGGPILSPAIAGVGTQIALVYGNSNVNEDSGPIFITRNPTKISTKIHTLRASKQGIGIGFILTKVTLQKNILSRIDNQDQFVLDIGGTPSATGTTTGNATGIQSTKPYVYSSVSYNVPASTFTIDESMAPGSENSLSAYYINTTAVNLIPQSPEPPVGILPISVTPQLGDNIIYTISNGAIDFGDAPDMSIGTSHNNYKTTLANDGPRHVLSDSLYLGTRVTGEADAYQNSIATGDDIIKGIQDDLITSLPTLLTNATTYQVPVTLTNNTGLNANLYAWIDINENGVFEGNEAVTATVLPLGTQVINLTFNVPANTVLPNNTFARFRLTTDNLVNKNANDLTLEDTRSIGLASDGEVEDYFLPVEEPNLIAIKSVDKALADLGDILTYTVILKNNSLTAFLSNILFTDIDPAGTTFVGGTLIVDTAYTGTAPGSGITITSIAPGQVVNIKWQVRVDEITIPNPNPVTNVGEIQIPNVLTPQLTNSVSTKINHGQITKNNAVKSSDKSITTPGDVVTYNVSLKNTGSVSTDNVVVKDIIPTGTTFVLGSVTIDNISKPSENPKNGINVGTINPSQTVLVSFKVTVLDDAPKVLSNIATIHYSYKVDPSSIATNETVNTNIVDITVVKAKVDMSKTSNRVGATVSDIIRYTIVVENTGEVALNSVVVKDVLDSNLSYENNLTVNGVPTQGNITTGVNIGSIGIGKKAIVSFDAKVISIPSDKMIINKANANYAYVVSGNTFDGSFSSPQNSVIVYNPNLVITKNSNKNFVKVGDTFMYTITASNKGDIDVENVIIKDNLPSGFKVLDVKVDGVSVNADLTTGLNIGTIKIGQSKIVEIIVEVIGDVDNIYKNIVNVTAQIVTDPNLPPTVINTSATDNIGVTVYNPLLSLIKKSDKKYVSVGDTVTYTIIATNIGDIPLGTNIDPIIIYDIVSSELEFVSDSIVIDNISYPMINISQGIDIGMLDVGESKEISFKVKVLSSKTNPIENKATSTFGFGLPNMPSQMGFSVSNIYAIIPEVANIDVAKSSDKDFTMLGDVITYTVKLTNNGTVDALNVIFKDNLPKEVELINGSFKINNTIVNKVNLSRGVNVGNIAVRSATTIEYKVKVISSNCTLHIVNEAIVDFDYIFKDNTTASSTSYTTLNSATLVNLAISNFKQLSIEDYLSIPTQKPDIEQINNVKSFVEIVQCHVVETNKVKSVEGQNLSGYKLIIHGTLKEVIEYTACETQQSVHSATYTIPFSTFIILPNDYKIGSKIETEGVVEHVYSNVIDCRTVFTNATILINSKIIGC